MLGEFTSWLLQLVAAFFSGLWDFIQDAFVQIADLVLGAMASLFAAIPIPAWLSGGLNSVYSQLDPGIVYLLTQSGLPAGLAVIGAAYVFRLGRKIVTLFQW